MGAGWHWMLALALVASAFAQDPQLQFGEARALSIDRQGRFYVVDRARCQVQVLAADGHSLRTIGRPGTAADGAFLGPSGVSAGDGFFLVVADSDNGRVVRYATDLEGKAHAFDRVLLDRGGLAGGLFRPVDVDYDAGGRLAVLDAEQNEVLLLDPFGRIERRCGGFGDQPGRLRAPVSVAYDQRFGVFVADGERVVVFDAFGSFRSNWALPGGGLLGLALDAKGRLAVAGGGAVYLLSRQGELLKTLRPSPQPIDLAFGPDGGLHVLDGKTGALQRVDASQ